jgi:hypothetical protein
MTAFSAAGSKETGPGLRVNIFVTADRGDAEFRQSVEALAIPNSEVYDHTQLVTEDGAPLPVTSLRIRSLARRDEELGRHIDALQRQIRDANADAVLARVGQRHKIYLSCYLACNDDFPPMFVSAEQLSWLGGLHCAVDIDINRYSRTRQ